MIGEKIRILDDVKEYCEGEAVKLWRDACGRVVIRSYNEARNNGTAIDLLDLIKWLLSSQSVGLGLDFESLRSELSLGADLSGHRKVD